MGMAKIVLQSGVTTTLTAVVALGLGQQAHSAESASAPPTEQLGICAGYGPQAPRDIDQQQGSNAIGFPVAAAAARMNLCNLHIHGGAEHRAAAFDVPSDEGAGFRCAMSQRLEDAERAPFTGNACEGIEPGDTIEVHWVYSTCDVAPGPGLGACLSEQCANPGLRVESQVFTVVNDENATDFARFAALVRRDGFHQPSALPQGTGEPATYLGSTTGPSYSDATCSPLQVSWSVRPQCAKLSIASLSQWCAGNVFEEDHAHGVRPLVTHAALLSPIEASERR
jgi:hypothetical protein